VIHTFHEAIGAVEAYSPAEERFNRRRRTAGLGLAPVAFAATLVSPLPGLGAQAHHMAAVVALVAVLWLTEALPLAVTALLGPMLAVLLGVAPARTALAPFADPVIFLFIGSFMLAEAMFVHALDRRVAFTALASSFVGASLARLVLVYAALATAISMWVSNVATTAMMFPIALSVIAYLARTGAAADPRFRRFTLALMLLTSFGPSVGGMATPVGTPPNLIGISILERHGGVPVSFFRWVGVGLPIVAVLFLFLFAYFYLTCLRGLTLPASTSDHVRLELESLGPLTPGQRNVMFAFGVTILLWISPGLLALGGPAGVALSIAMSEAIPEGVAAMVGAILLFVLPIDWRSRRFTLTWSEAVRIDWGIILLYGGGLAIGELAFSSGLAEAAGHGLAAWLPSHSTFSLTLLFTIFSILVSEVTSNTAAATMIVPIAVAVSLASGVRPLEPALGATLGASMGFIMPVSTAPNAIVYSSGHVPITAMIRHGLVLDLAAAIVIVPMVLLFGGLLF